MIREGADARTSGQIYLVVVQLVLFYRSDMWVMTPRIGRVWGRFHHRVACRLTGRKLKIGRYRVWIYPLMEDEMTEAGMQEVVTYASHPQNTVKQFITTRPIVDLCMAEKQRLGSRISKWWWEQDGVDVEGTEAQEE